MNTARRRRAPTLSPSPAQVEQLLARWDRKQRRVESRFKPDGLHQRATFDEFIAAADKKLRALGLRSEWPPKDEGSRNGGVTGGTTIRESMREASR